MICFECKKEIIETEKEDSILEVRWFHGRCVRKIISKHVFDILDREADIDRKSKIWNIIA